MRKKMMTLLLSGVIALAGLQLQKIDVKAITNNSKTLYTTITSSLVTIGTFDIVTNEFKLADPRLMTTIKVTYNNPTGAIPPINTRYYTISFDKLNKAYVCSPSNPYIIITRIQVPNV